MHTPIACDWNVYASCYDALLRVRPYVDMLTDVIEQLRLLQPTSVLDAGCGTGNVTLRINEAIPSVTRLVAIDASTEMLSCARQKARGRDISFVSADLNEPLPYYGEPFDAITCVNALYAVADPSATLREFYNVLRPGGALVLVTPKAGYENGLIAKAHCRSNKPDSYWLNGHASAQRETELVREAFGDEQTVQEMLFVAAINRHIAAERRFHFFAAPALVAAVTGAGYEVQTCTATYAEQSLLLVATRH